MAQKKNVTRTSGAKGSQEVGIMTKAYGKSSGYKTSPRKVVDPKSKG